MNYCNRQCKDSCYTITINDISELVYGIDKKVCKIGEDNQKALCWNIGCTDFKVVNELTIYKDTLERYKTRLIRNSQPCICPDDLQCIIEKVLDIVPKSSCGECVESLIIDNSNLDEWVRTNPYCCSYEQWNKYSKCKCKDLELTITSEKQLCDFTFELETNIIPCEILYCAEVYKEKHCELEYKVNRTYDECKLDYKILVEKLPECNLEFKVYKELIDCGISYDIIKEVYKNPTLSFVIDHQKDDECKVQLNTTLNQYCFKDLAVPIEILEKNKLNINIDPDKISGDYKQ